MVPSLVGAEPLSRPRDYFHKVPKKSAALPPVVSNLQLEARLSLAELTECTFPNYRFSIEQYKHSCSSINSLIIFRPNSNSSSPSSTMTGSTGTSLVESRTDPKRASLITLTMGTLTAAWKRRSDMFSTSNGPPRSLLFERYGVCDRRSIGTGAFATVKLAHKTDPAVKGGLVYAVKAFRSRQSGETPKQYLKRLTGEFCIGSSLVHPNIVSIIDLVQDDDERWCQIMEYCQGGDLFTLMSQGNLEPPHAISLFSQLLHAVKFLHTNGVVHRDLKPENLLLDQHGILKVSDFGSSEVIKQPWSSDTFYPCCGPSGSQPYISPESFEENDFDGRKADIWSCGIILNYMLTGQLPWKIARAPSAQPTIYTTSLPSDSNYAAYLSNGTLPANLPIISNISPKSFITNLLSVDPNRRPFVDQALLDPILQLP